MIILLLLTALSIAGSAAFFTMYGLAMTFASGFWPVLIGGATIEAGKLVMASYVYRYWHSIRWFFRPVYIILILLAMFFTSIGVFGYLSAAYQKDSLPLDEITTRLEALDQKSETLTQLKDEQVLQRQRLLDDKNRELAALPGNFATKQKAVSLRYQPQLDRLTAEIDGYNLRLRALIDEKQEIRVQTIQQESKTGPIVFIGQAFGWDTDQAVKWLIIIIVIIFDPMAVMLVIGANVAIAERQAHKRRRKDDRVHLMEKALETAEKPSEPTISEVEEVLSEDETAHLSADDIRKMVEEMNTRKLDRIEVQQKQMLEELLARKTLTEKIRNPNQE